MKDICSTWIAWKVSHGQWCKLSFWGIWQLPWDDGIKHWKVTPYLPQANASVESFRKTIEKAICTTHASCWRQGLVCRQVYRSYLHNYHAMPHATTEALPARLHLGCEIRTKVPQIEAQSTIWKKMVVEHFTTIPCEPSIGKRNT